MVIFGDREKNTVFWTTSLKIILRIFQLKHWQTTNLSGILSAKHEPLPAPWHETEFWKWIRILPLMKFPSVVSVNRARMLRWKSGKLGFSQICRLIGPRQYTCSNFGTIFVREVQFFKLHLHFSWKNTHNRRHGLWIFGTTNSHKQHYYHLLPLNQNQMIPF